MRLIPKKVLIGVASLLVAAGAFVALTSYTGTSADALTMGTRQDCGYTDTIVDCGTTSTQQLLDVYNSNNDRRGNRDIQAIFNHFGITPAEISSTNTKKGWLNTNGTIEVGGQVVAKNAQSLYRVHPGKTVSTYAIGGKTYYMGPVAGNYGLGADVFVFFNADGTFRTALQASCGNPIPATNTVVPPKPPVPTPVYKCESLVAKSINRTTYEFTATASAANGAKIVSYNYDFGNGRKVTTPQTTITNDYGTEARSYTATVTVNVEVNGKIVVTPIGNCKVTVVVKAPPVVPAFKCESLKIGQKISRTEFRLDAVASATNATIKSYTFNFGDGTSQVVTTSAKTASATHKYAEVAKSYEAEVIVTMSDGTRAPGVCKVTVVVDEKPVVDKPSVDISKTVNGKEHAKVDVNAQFTYEITVRNTGNVVLKNAVVTDKAPAEVTLLSAAVGTINGNVWTHTISDLNVGESKTFFIKAKYAKYAAGTHKNTVCVETPTVPGTNPDDCDDATTETHELIEVCDLTDNTIKTIERSEFDASHMTTDLSKCGEIKVCIIEDKVIKTIAKNQYNESTMTTDMSKCAETPVVPAELPKTGLDAFLGGGLGIGSITAASYYWSASRRNLVNALLKK